MTYLLFGLAIVVGGWVFWNIVVPIGDWILRLIGYGIYTVWVTPWRKSKSWHHALRFLLIAIPKHCLSESGTLGSVWASEVSTKGKKWRPYFGYQNSSTSK